MKTRKCTLLITYACNLHCTYCYEKFKNPAVAPTMTFDTACRIIEQEIGALQHSNRFDFVEFNFFGGEPLLQFPLIREVVEWAEKSELTEYCTFSATSNGTLADAQILDWCAQHKDHFALGLSIDGISKIQQANRGCNTADLPIEFARRTWSSRPFKMTISQQSLPNFAESVLYLQTNNYHFICSLAEGTAWRDCDAEIYGQQLQQLADYYLNHRNQKPMHLFLKSLQQVVAGSTLPQRKSCGMGDYSVAYDFQGEIYPCISLTPIVTGSNCLQNNYNIDFTEESTDFQDPACTCCILKNGCPTCYGQNKIYRESFARRDHNSCKMLLTEIKIVAELQRDYLLQQQTPLSTEQQQRLQNALFILDQLPKV